MSDRPLLPPARRSPAAAASNAAFHAEVVAEVAATVERDTVVVVGMAQNPVVKKARAALDAAGQPFTYIEHGSYFSAWKPRLAIKMWSGWPTFPQVFVKGALIGGHAELAAAIEAGDLARWVGGEDPAAG